MYNAGIAGLTIIGHMAAALEALLKEIQSLTGPIMDAARVLAETRTDRRLGLPGAGRDALLAAAHQGVQRWTAIANTAISPRARDVARVITRSLDLECDRLGGEQP